MELQKRYRQLLKRVIDSIYTEPPPALNSAAVPGSDRQKLDKPGEKVTDSVRETAGGEAPSDPAPEEQGADVPDPGGQTLLCSWEAALGQLTEREREVLLRRFGLSGRDSETLQVIGDSLGITRERVRQLGTRTAAKVFGRPEISEQAAQRVAGHSSDGPDLLTVGWLQSNDPWFRGAEPRVVALAIERSGQPQHRHCIEIEGEFYVADFSPATWRRNLDRACEMLRNRVKERPRPRRSELHRELALLLSDDAESGWGRRLMRSAAPRALFASAPAPGAARDDSDAPDSDDDVLVSLRATAEGYVAKILLEIERPVHFSEVPKLLLERYGFKIDPRRAHNALGNSGHLFDRGVYGSPRHLPMGQGKARALVRRIEKLALGEEFAGQQWHCNEMLQALARSGRSTEGLNVYLLHTLLKLHSKRLDDLGRQMWIAGSGRPRDAGRRVRLFETAESILERHGAPMSNLELCRRVADERGRSKALTLQSRGRLVRINESRWGLIDRGRSAQRGADRAIRPGRSGPPGGGLGSQRRRAPGDRRIRHRFAGAEPRDAERSAAAVGEGCRRPGGRGARQVAAAAS